MELPWEVRRTSLPPRHGTLTKYLSECTKGRREVGWGSGFHGAAVSLGTKRPIFQTPA